MLYTTDSKRIEKFLIGRTALEQELARRLVTQFRKRDKDLYWRINAAVGKCFETLQNLEEEGLQSAIHECEIANDYLFKGCADKTVEWVANYCKNGGEFSPEACGNLIRFYGEVVEKLASFSIYWKRERMKQIGWRYGGGGEFFKAKQSLQEYDDGEIQAKDVHIAQADQGSVWRKDKWLSTKKVTGTKVVDGDKITKDVVVPKLVAHWEQKPDQSKGGVLSWQKSVLPAPDAGPGGRRRLAQKGNKVDTLFGKAGQEKKPNPYYGLIPGNVFENEELKKVHIGKKFGGIMEWKILDSSTLGMIDRVFGLPYGADISGTTSDELHFLTGWADISSGDPLVMMLPLAVIVGEYHHTLLEVAAAMSLRKVISYSIGFYSTLLPKLPPSVTKEDKHPQRSDIEELLSSCEKDARNSHIVLYYDSNHKIAGCYIAEDDDLPAFKKLGTIDISLWPKFSKLPEYPSEDNIMGLLREVGLGNAALTARVRALRPAA